MTSIAEISPVKCVVWDLDNTLWHGTLLELEQGADAADVVLKPHMAEAIKALDERGILQSIASKNHFDSARQKLQQLGLWDYFLSPQINWNAKSGSLQQIASDLNIALDTFAFIDDQPFELEEVLFEHPQVMLIDAGGLSEAAQLLQLERMQPKHHSAETAKRRKMYQDDQQREAAEKAFAGPSEAFLASLNIKLTVSHAAADDLQRAQELTQRTHQLNTTGYTYSQQQLESFSRSADHLLLVARLSDNYGSYGTIGLILVEKHPQYWQIKLLLMSCRVMSRGIGNVLISLVMTRAKAAGVRLRADFIANDRNRLMYITYKFGGFQTLSETGKHTVFEHALDEIKPVPNHIEVTFEQQ